MFVAQWNGGNQKPQVASNQENFTSAFVHFQHTHIKMTTKNDNDNYDDEEEESLQRALADLEIIQSAYPDEVKTTTTTTTTTTINDDSTTLTFPLQFTLYLERENKASIESSVTMEFQKGYPKDSAIQVASFRTNHSKDKNRMEKVITEIRRVALECQQEEMESAISCCAIALETWQEHDENNEIDNNNNGYGNEGLATTTNNNGNDNTSLLPSSSTTALPKTKIYNWISGEPLVDQKSTFIAHLCRVESEKEVYEALEQLISGSSKIQRATHNMFAWRVSEKQPDGRIVSKHDNDDDGEAAAGSKLAYLLDMRKDENVLVVVSRWYGGIQLGPKRFADIINVARILLVEHCGEKK